MHSPQSLAPTIHYQIEANLLPDQDRREIERQPGADHPITFVTSDGEMILAERKNVSADGLGVVCDRYFAPGTTVRIFLPSITKNAARFLSAEVRHATAQPDGRWVLGCILGRLLTDDELSAFA